MSEYVTVKAEPTDDPEVMELVTNQHLTDEEEEVYYSRLEMEAGSVLAQALFFAVDGMREMIITEDSLIVKREPGVPWEVLVDEIRDALRDYYL